MNFAECLRDCIGKMNGDLSQMCHHRISDIHRINRVDEYTALWIEAVKAEMDKILDGEVRLRIFPY